MEGSRRKGGAHIIHDPDHPTDNLPRVSSAVLPFRGNKDYRCSLVRAYGSVLSMIVVLIHCMQRLNVQWNEDRPSKNQ